MLQADAEPSCHINSLSYSVNRFTKWRKTLLFSYCNMKWRQVSGEQFWTQSHKESVSVFAWNHPRKTKSCLCRQ